MIDPTASGVSAAVTQGPGHSGGLHGNRVIGIGTAAQGKLDRLNQAREPRDLADLAEAVDTTPEFWMGLQADHDLWHALRKRAAAKGKRSPTARRTRRASAQAPGRYRSA